MHGEIKLITTQGTSSITKDNFSESLEKIVKMLTPGTPVMFDGYAKTTRSGPFPAHDVKKYLFYSDGTVTPDGGFRFQEGKRTDLYVAFTRKDNPEQYILNIISRDRSLPQKILIPHSDIEGGALVGEGTTEIIIGGNLRLQYGNAMNAMDFARNAINVVLDNSYVTFAPIYHTREKFNGPRKEFESLRKKFGGSKEEFEAASKKFNGFKEEFEKFEKNFTEYALVTAARNLLLEARVQNKKPAGIEIVPLERYYLDSQKNLIEKYALDINDFVIRGPDGTGKNADIAILKIAHRLFPGQLFVLPAQDMDEFVESAFSEQAVAAYYPKKSTIFL
ncbi:MAG: hypothetical protein WC916_03455 [Candidatus Woesearchaeota archaeon]